MPRRLLCPQSGEIAIFNRSHYEDVVAVRVRGLAPALAVAELLVDTLERLDPKLPAPDPGFDRAAIV